MNKIAETRLKIKIKINKRFRRAGERPAFLTIPSQDGAIAQP